MSFDKEQESGHPDKDGKNAQVAQSEAKADGDVVTEKKEQAIEAAIPAPSVGFDESGEYFVTKIHVRYGITFIRGFLREADDWIRAFVIKQRMDQEKNAIIKPGQTQKGRGIFNLFK